MNTSPYKWILTLAVFAPMSFSAQAVTPWQQVTNDGTPPAHAMHGVVVGSNGFLAAGSTCSIKASNEGLSWLPVDGEFSGCFFHDIAWDGERYVAVGHRGGDARLSIYDSTWNPIGHMEEVFGSWYAATALPGTGAGFMIIGRDGDGWIKVWWLEWLEGVPTLTLGASLETAEGIGDVIWDGTQYVAVGRAGTIMTSADGSNWAPKPSGTGVMLWGIAFNSTLNTYVAVGDNNTILYSQDQAQTWTLQTAPNPHGLLGVAWNGAKFVAVGTGNRVLSSSTGSIWFEERVANLPTSTYLHDVAWSPALKRWIAVGENGVVVTNESIFSGHFEPRVPRPSPF